MLGAFSLPGLPLLSCKLTTSFFDSWLFKMSLSLTSELITGFTVSVEGTSFGWGEGGVVVVEVVAMVLVVVVVGAVVTLSTYCVWNTDLSTQANVSLSVSWCRSTPLQTDCRPRPAGEALKLHVEYP